MKHQVTTAAASPALTDRSGAHRMRLALAGLLILATILGARGITSESAVSLYDTPRYLMNAVFVADFLKSGTPWTVEAVMRYAEHYFARYPALSLGHHPPLISMVLVPFDLVFGVSVFWPRVVATGFFLLATAMMFSIARRLYNAEVAIWTTLLFVTNPFVVTYGQQVLSEMPMLALILMSVNALLRFVDSSKTKDFTWFVAAAVASLYAKPLAVYMFPVYGVILLFRVNWRRLVRWDVVGLTCLLAVLCAPMLLMSFLLSPANVAFVQTTVASGRGGSTGWPTILRTILEVHLTLPVLTVVAAGVCVAVIRRDWRIGIGLAWITVIVLSVILITGRFDSPRYALAATPGYFLAAGSLAAGMASTREKRAVIALLIIALGWQGWLVRKVRPTGAGGYEAAAEYVASNGPSPTILFSGPVDVGYFVFFVRKHDPDHRMIVLRAEKILGTNRMQRTRHTINSADEIDPIMRRLGTRFVVVEERSGDRIFNLVAEYVKRPQFVERLRTPIETRDPRLFHVDLVVYENMAAQPPDPDADIDIGLPMAGRPLDVKLGDLIDQ
jgi:4-amino-4-deoxy-L-arabinose transferase-like glycosyltransferase